MKKPIQFVALILMLLSVSIPSFADMVAVVRNSDGDIIYADDLVQTHRGQIFTVLQVTDKDGKDKGSSSVRFPKADCDGPVRHFQLGTVPGHISFKDEPKGSHTTLDLAANWMCRQYEKTPVELRGD